MSEGKIAFRYAKPLLELAEEKNVLDQVNEDMASFASLCDENREFALMLKSPIIPHFTKAKILKKLFRGKYHELTVQALDLITRKNRETILELIAKKFVHLYNVKKGIAEVSVTTAIELDTKMRMSFHKLAKEISGNEPILTERINPNILGGFILKVGDKQIDDSVRGKLNKLKLQFSNK